MRIVAFVLRQTLGWLDSNGQPLREEISISYSDLIRNAGVSRGAARAAITEVIEKRFIVQTSVGKSKSAGQAGSSSAFRLRWSEDLSYQKAIDRFDGFYTGEGCRTPVPNSFFDAIIPNEKLNVVKIVGAVIRHTIGYQNQFGGRQSSAPLSHRYLERYANISVGKAVSDAIKASEAAGFIERVSTGKFNPNSEVRQSTCYRVRWCCSAKKTAFGSKIPAVDSGRTNIPSSNGSNSPAGDRFKNPSKEKTPLKNNNKQQSAAEFNRESVNTLQSQGFDESSAIQIAKQYSPEAIERQIEWLDARNPTNRVAMLRRAIEQDWTMPTEMIAKEKIRQSRIRDQKASEEESQNAHEASIRKHGRNNRRERLLSEWKKSNAEQRRKWLAAAMKNETSESIIRIISRQHERTEIPHMNVLNVVAAKRGLSPLFEVAKPQKAATL